MKKQLLVILSGLSLMSGSAHAVALLCGSPVHNVQIDGNGSSHHNLMKEGVVAGCNIYDLKPEIEVSEFEIQRLGLVEIEKTHVSLKGIGPGGRLTLAEGFMINCPLITKAENLKKAPFFGVKVSAGLGVGGSVGVFVNKRLGVCVLTSVSGGTIGVGLSGARLDF